MNYPHPMDDKTGFEATDAEMGLPVRCEACDGQGSIEKPAPQRDDPHYCSVVPCADCNGNGWI